ncbi:kinesin-domain-containing protein [Rhodofomes roseus]|uniref:Kinesin-domain-containing protein n=1 Tax=Rhodofomes roseus TaxID=34475 RepID=A0ABQ8K716_9APHY|nr:kinesin-domain-containing protein [Rhodofomes roseus]KAH9832952.1 kinesin-domain-containing protein [Rhodofomes roseus]
MAPSPASSAGSATSVQVAVRIRPTTTQDTSSTPARFQRSVVNAVSPTTVAIDPVSSAAGGGAPAPAAPSAKKQVFTFDQVHQPATTQHAMFTTTAQPLISRFIEGFNCTILAYGQTSSGKTFTMTGIDLDADPNDPTNGMGIIPRAVSTIFARCRELKQERGDSWQYSLRGSFIELYNEDLIDLLNLEDGGGKQVQIREDKQGHIIWEGLREVGVRGPNEVMGLLQQGTAIRRTNETDMNAQSSRSHAIFSLTLTQKKYSGSKPPPRSSSPLPPGGRPGSRIARPGSTMYNSSQASRVSSPTFGRPSTPSFQSAIGRGGRPASSLGLLSPDRGLANNAADDSEGEWVTVVSKFHFVDLAGSERIKRTGAAGDRIKEGISINSGLLALGNVISALGDPARAKSHTASYIPYRDSKLTRLLQDSLGGNAHTLMIACVSPTEWNVGETVNTLKYANRARNIKNRAVVNEKEEGWDDLEWLQGNITRLRKELKALKEGGATAAGSSAATNSVDIPDGAGKKVLAQMAELQNNYEDMREKFVERTEELTRLRRELAEKQRSSKGNMSGTAKYEEIVGPVIEEYEKTIGAMEAELNLNRAALRHTNDLYEEKEHEYTELAEKHSTTELYVEELKSRVAKLMEREASNEAYIRDLEEKVKQSDETSVSSSGSITDLKREISRYKDSETYNTQYIADVEARLTRADESVLALRETVEKLERECDRRRDEAEVLQERLDALLRDGESWRTDLEEREQKVRDLEAKMQGWETRKKEADEDRQRLNELVGEVAKARKELEAKSITPSLRSAASTDTLGGKSQLNGIGPAEEQFIVLQQTHTATLADLSSVTAKYHDALREIADLAAQLEEAKVNAPLAPSESEDRPADLSPRRRMGRGSPSSETLVNGNGSARRGFSRHQVASSESLTSRYALTIAGLRDGTNGKSLSSRSLPQSVSLSQELSSARSRKASTSSHGTSSSVSLSHSRSRPNLSISLPGVNISPNERSVASLEKEIMRLQEVLQERETEITALETSLKDKDRAVALANLERSPPPDVTVTPMNGHVPESSLPLSPRTMSRFKDLRHSLHIQVSENGLPPTEVDQNLERLNELMRSMAAKESAHREKVDTLNSDLSQVRRQFEELTVLSRDQTLNMSNEIEGLRKKHEEDLAKHDEDLQRLERLEKREAELVEATTRLEQHEAELAESLATAQSREKELMESLERIQAEHSADVEKLKSEHEDALRAKAAEVDALVAKLKEEHSGAVLELQGQLAQASAALDKAREDHVTAFGELKAEHEDELKRRSQGVDDLLEHTQQEHEAAVSKLKDEHADAVKQKEEEASATLHKTEGEYYEALTKLRAEHAQALEKQTSEAATAMERLRDEHAREVRMSEIAREGSLSESASAMDIAMKNLQEEHASAASAKEQQFAEDIQKLKDEHTQTLEAKEEQYRSSKERLKASHTETLHAKEATFADELAKLQAEHQQVLASKDEAHRTELEKHVAEHADMVAKLQEESQKEIARLTSELEQSRTEFTSSGSKLQEQMEAELQSVKEQQATILAEVEKGHAEEVARLQEAHNAAIAAADSQAEEQRTSLMASHAEEVARLRAEHESALSAVQAELSLDESRERTEQLLSEEKERLKSSLTELEQKHADEVALSEMQRERDDEELESYKAASDEYEALQQKTEVIGLLHQQLSSSNDERDTLAAESNDLVREASKRQSLVDELERHRSMIADLQEDLQRTKDEMDNLSAEKSRQETLLRDLQSQTVMSPTPSTRQGFGRSNMSPTKLPPPAPPPTHQLSTSGDTPQDSPTTPATSLAPEKLTAQIQQQAKHIDEQDAMIKTLNKQLMHCESDLQAHIDLVSSLESSVGDAEKNQLARMQATELARERDSLNSQLADARNEVVNVRRSLDEERRAKERARAQLDSRMDELQRRKSKFACL